MLLPPSGTVVTFGEFVMILELHRQGLKVFEVEFTDERDADRLALHGVGYSRLIWARFVIHQDLQSVLRCHIAALEAIGGVPREILYDRMKTAVIGEDPDGRRFR
jgi:hypothetical protein